MDAKARREKIAERLKYSRQPVTGAALSQEMGVSRQVIVADIALLRSLGLVIYATPGGYLLPPPLGPTRSIAARHEGLPAMQEELETIVALGGKVLDISIEHAVYGEFRATLMLQTLEEVSAFINQMKSSGMAPMSALTGGVHMHGIAAGSEKELDAIIEALHSRGFLVE
ncbi:MAG: transcription repressor NadR [Christensenellaceae bacterium]|jgi:transcriptional regulator of NAD metabolism|nr:transcription repressor NadR [Christensenellaceae bacterium]